MSDRLGPLAQRELDTSYVTITDFPTPGRVVSNGFGLIKEVRRGRGTANPDPAFLWRDVLNLIADPATYGTPHAVA